MSRTSPALALLLICALSATATAQIPHYDAGCRIPVVVAADRPATSEAGGTATFRIVFACPVHTDNLVVVFTFEGTATEGVDYTHDAGYWNAAGMNYVLFAPGETVKDVTLTGVDDAATEGPETVALQLHPPSFYFGPDRYFLVPPSDRAEVTLEDTEPADCGGDPVPPVPPVPQTGLEPLVAPAPGPHADVRLFV